MDRRMDKILTADTALALHHTVKMGYLNKCYRHNHTLKTAKNENPKSACHCRAYDGI